jgi:hypothetical protein
MTVKPEEVNVMGQMVVDTAEVKVMIVVEDTGQSVTLEAQLRMVCSTVVYTVDVTTAGCKLTRTTVVTM